MRTLDILLLEDNIVTANEFKQELEKQGHTVQLASTVREALDLNRERAYDLYVLDLRVEMNKGEDDLSDGGIIVAKAVTNRWGYSKNKLYNSTIPSKPEKPLLKQIGYISDVSGEVVEIGKNTETLNAVLKQIL